MPRSSGSLRLRLRGGADEDNTDDMAPLTDDEITEKLNAVPAFVIMGAGDGFVALELRDEGRAVCFFTDVNEAKAVFNMTQTSHPEANLRLVCTGLGNAMKLVNGDDRDEAAEEAFASFDGKLKLQAPHQLVEAVRPKLEKMMEKAEIDPGNWLVPIFICEELQGPGFLPVFLDPGEIKTMWTKAGRKEEDLGNKFVMMDIRMLMKEMKQSNMMPWKKVHFVSTKEAAEYANELREAQLAAGA